MATNGITLPTVTLIAHQFSHAFKAFLVTSNIGTVSSGVGLGCYTFIDHARKASYMGFQRIFDGVPGHPPTRVQYGLEA